MAKVETRFVCDLSKPVQAQVLKGNVFSLDNLGSRISVLVYDNGSPATITGSVTANCILPDGSTVNVNGSLTTENGGSKAYVDIPQSCLLIPGILKIAIKVTASSVITTLAAIVANVYMTKTDNVITPSQQVITDWNAEISAAIATQDAAIAAQDDKITDLENAFDLLVDGVADEAYGTPTSSTPGVNPGYMTNAGAVQTGNYTYTDKIAVIPGDRVIGYKNGAVYPFRFVTAYSDDTVYSAKGSGSTVYEYIVPEGINYIRVSTAIVSTGSDTLTINIEHKIYVNNLTDEVTDIPIIEKCIAIPNLADPSKFTDNYYMSNAGQSTYNTTYGYTGRIPVSAGDVLYFTSSARYVCAFNSSNQAVSASGSSSSSTSYTVPSGIVEIIVTFNMSDKATFMVSKYQGLSYVPYGEPYIVRSYLPELEQNTEDVAELDGRVSAIENVVGNTKTNYSRQAGNLTNGQYLLIDKLLSVQKNVKIVFSGNISGEFAGIEIGYTTNISQSDLSHFKVDSTKIYRVTSNPSEMAHGLTISGNVVITLENTIDSRLKITVESNGQKATSTNGWAVGSSKAYVKALSTLNDCVFTWCCTDLFADVALFGDSYMSYGTDRWRYYLHEDGYGDNTLVNSYAGENSENGMVNFNALIPMSNAKFALWAYGMNDADNGAINASWKTNADAFVSYCESHGIIPILSTVPNVATRDNSYKNAYVRGLGKRYIDFAKAVGSDESTSWFSGMLSQDGIHPTAMGAMALYYRALADFPELMIRQ